MTDPGRARGAPQGLLAAALFGLSAPLSKALLGDVAPQLLAALLYLGAAAALSVVIRVRPPTTEARLARSDWPWLAAITVTGGVIAPVIMLVGLERTSAVAGSLLLNLEAPFTILLAVAVFGEHLDRRSMTAATLIIGAGAVLGFGPGALRADAVGALCLAGACALWAVDNNLTQRLTDRDPVALVRAKALAAGALNLVVALALGDALPRPGIVAAALAVGAAAYGVSIVLDAYALRIAGAAREAAYFATGPFFGALAAVPLLGESMSGRDAVTFALMAGGVALLLVGRHEHPHTHAVLEHEHRHRHDDGHHTHTHDGPTPEGWHSHPHRHDPVTHTHPHDSDIHHRHQHPHD